MNWRVYRFATMVTLAVASGAGGPALAAGRGETLFEPCRSCHSLESGTAGLAGPGLGGLAGRPVAGAPDYDYSPVLRAAGAAGQVWDRTKLIAFLADPEGMFSGMWMSARGLAHPDDREALADHILSGR